MIDLLSQSASTPLLALAEQPGVVSSLWQRALNMPAVEWLFLVFAALAVFSAVATVTRRNPVVAAVWLIASFFCVAACYVLLSATFLGVIQVLVYAGAMMVLFVFVIMVLDVDESGATEHRRPSPVGILGYFGSVLVAVAFLAWVFAGTLSRQYMTPGAPLPLGGEFGTANGLGRLLFREYLFAFEAISMLLLAAVIGAVVVARSRREREKEAAQVGMGPEARLAAGLSDHPREYEATSPTPAYDFGAPSGSGHDGGL